MGRGAGASFEMGYGDGVDDKQVPLGGIHRSSKRRGQHWKIPAGIGNEGKG